MQDNCEVAESPARTKAPIFNMKLKIVNEHYLISFEYGKDIIYHTKEEVVDSVLKKIEEIEQWQKIKK